MPAADPARPGVFDRSDRSTRLAISYAPSDGASALITPRLAILPRRLIAAVGLLIAGAVAVSVATTVSQAAPEPAPVPKRWQLDLRPGPLRLAIVDVDGLGPRAYFYLTYTVVNNSGQDLQFAPSFELATDDGELVRSGRDVPSEVVQELQRRLKNDLLEDEIRIMGSLLQGEEHGKEGLVVWPAQSLKVDEIVVYAAGFSGETRRIPRPDSGEEVTLRKVMMLRHASPGELTGRGAEPFERTVERWILR